MKLDDFVTKMINMKSYPNQPPNVYLFFSHNNRNKFFINIKRKLEDKGKIKNVDFELAYKKRIVNYANTHLLYFIQDLDDSEFLQLDRITAVFYDDDEFIRSRPFYYKVRPLLEYGKIVRDYTYYMDGYE